MPFESPSPPYTFSFVTGALFVQETLAVASKLQLNRDWKAVISAVRAENLLRQRTLASTARLLREIRYRLEKLSASELDFLVKADPRDQRLLLFIAVCRRYRFIREFTTDVRRRWMCRHWSRSRKITFWAARFICFKTIPAAMPGKRSGLKHRRQTPNRWKVCHSAT